MQTFVLFKIRKKWQCLKLYDIIQVKINFFLIQEMLLLKRRELYEEK